MQIHVDFTPMVDMNMLLITFFMLCTTMIKSQTLQITLPTSEKVEQEQMNKAKESRGYHAHRFDRPQGQRQKWPETMMEEQKNVVYYYADSPSSSTTTTTACSRTPTSRRKCSSATTAPRSEGIRKILHDRKAGTHQNQRPEGKMAQQGILVQQRQERLHLPGNGQGDPQRLH